MVAAAGEAIKTPVSGGGKPNPLCASEPEAVVDTSENAQSVGMLITLRQFSFPRSRRPDQDQRNISVLPRQFARHSGSLPDLAPWIGRFELQAMVDAFIRAWPS